MYTGEQDRSHREHAMRLYVPRCAVTAHSIAVVWDKVRSYDCRTEYVVCLDDAEWDRVSVTDYTFEDLAAETEYEILVMAVLDETVIKSNRLCVRTSREPKVLNIEEFGAVGDAKTLNTAAIQRAIDACPSGGLVCIPNGVFVSGAVFLKSDMTLYLQEGARLLGSGNTEDYPLMLMRWEGEEKLTHASLINTLADGTCYQNITIAGKGTIDGNGSVLLRRQIDEGKGKRGCVVSLYHVDGLYFKDITIRHSAFWCVHPVYCIGVSMNRIQVHTKYDEDGNLYEGIFNGDGIDPDSCREVCIFHSYICSQDDCIAVKSGKDVEGRRVGLPSKNIRISNCSFRSGFGVAMGSDMSGGVRHVLVQDCVFRDSFSIASVKTTRGRGGCIEDIVYDGCTLVNGDESTLPTKWFKGALYVDCFYSEDRDEPGSQEIVDEGTPVIRDILFRDIVIDTCEGYAVYLVGLVESPLAGLCLENVTARGPKGLKAENVDSIQMFNTKIRAKSDSEGE